VTVPTKIAAARASERLTKALIDLAAAGLRTLCSDPELSHLWLSERDQERAVAATLCPGCPVQLECWTAARAQRVTWGVWGSVDFTQKPNRPKPKIDTLP
jgi:Transcription factor WhiB